MRSVSSEGIKKLMEMEAVELMPYFDQAQKLTIGIGHLLTENELATGQLFIDGKFIDWKNGIAREQAMALMAQDIRAAEVVVGSNLRVPLEQHQFDALCFFCYNVGSSAFVNSTLLKRLNQGQYESVPGQIRLWVYVTRDGKKVASKGLRARREREILIWKGDPK